MTHLSELNAHLSDVGIVELSSSELSETDGGIGPALIIAAQIICATGIFGVAACGAALLTYGICKGVEAMVR